MQNFLLFAILAPIVFGIILKFTDLKKCRAAQAVSLLAVVAISVFVWLLVFDDNGAAQMIFKYSDKIYLGLKADGLGKIFAAMVAFLWPLSLCYSFVYMKHDANRFSYFAYYIMTYGIVLGIAFSANALTMYVFYEILTFITLPLITHTQTKEARRAGRFYLYYSLSGSSLALAGIIIIIAMTGGCDFVYGGTVGKPSGLLELAYLFTYFGFGVKAAIFPLCRWLPMASAAPTPTTALLHAVAVVKSGAFAVIRMTYCVFSATQLNNTWMQKVAIGFAILSIVYGSAMALKEQHLKRRFAYSTVANLSYIVVGALLCTQAGLEAAMLHFLFHSITKIGLFFCCGAIIETANANYVYELNGLGKKAPLIFTFFTVSGLSLIGVPLFAGFVSKYYLIESAFAVGGAVGYLAIGAIILSAILTSVYVFSVGFRAFAAKPLDCCAAIYENAKEADRGFLIITGLFAALAVGFGLASTPVVNVMKSLLGGIAG